MWSVCYWFRKVFSTVFFSSLVFPSTRKQSKKGSRKRRKTLFLNKVFPSATFDPLDQTHRRSVLVLTHQCTQLCTDCFVANHRQEESEDLRNSSEHNQQYNWIAKRRHQRRHGRSSITPFVWTYRWVCRSPRTQAQHLAEIHKHSLLVGTHILSCLSHAFFLTHTSALTLTHTVTQHVW